MKRVKIMLLSLALFAIVGGALAFKAKFQEDFCTTTAYDLGGNNYTCSIEPSGQAVTTKLCITTTQEGIEIDELPAPELVKVCTTTPHQVFGCTTTCPDLTSVESND